MQRSTAAGYDSVILNKELDMGISFKYEEPINKPFEILCELFEKEISNFMDEITYSDLSINNKNKKIFEVFAISNELSGSTMLSLFTQGARFVPIFIKITEINNSTSNVLLISGGSESVLGTDWGRNKGLAKKIIKILKN